MHPVPQAQGTNRVSALSGHIDWDRPIKFLWLQGLVDRSVQRELQHIVVRHGLSLPEYSTLSVLHATPELSNAELARRSLVTPQSMNEVIARLEQRHLVERRNHPDHGRILLTSVTEAGRGVIVGAAADVAAFEDELVDGIPADDVAQTKQVLTTVLSRLLERANAD
ncbi:MAG: MarR family winged helix-turn-helix transcriptional regulator [Ilumatobacter sp.]